MKCKEILTEYNEPQLEMNELWECAKAYLEKCAKNKSLESPLWRLTSRTGILQTGKRTPQGSTQNLWPWLHSMPEWRNYPDRLKSIFCATTEKIHFGGTDSQIKKAIFPFDNINSFGYCKKDFNSNRINYHGTDLSFLDLDYNMSKFRGDMETRDKFSFGNAVDRYNDWCVGDYEVTQSVEDAMAPVLFLKKGLPRKLFLPDSLNCELFTSYESLINGAEPLNANGDEVWFEGGYISIPENQLSTFEDIIKELSK